MFTRHASTPAHRLPKMLGAGLATTLIGAGLTGCGAETVEVEFRVIAVETGTQPQTTTTNPADLTSMDWKLGPAIGGEHGTLDTATTEPIVVKRESNDLSDVRVSFDVPQAAHLAAKCTILINGEVVAEHQDNVKPGRALCTYVDQ
ncbi:MULTISPECIES: hypothetical protein [Micrococcaceae]|uniref:hypothetical protein n=1 Tax=Micrococcaceae TaxID=1268 RepID=UPI0008A49C18|nr:MULTISPECIES: hypothetical protein [Micrococcaceae]MCG7304813.1 hypothetical protein [Pseudoglutamicibacter albus]OFT23349.1 hypothetical protein HMPREF3175_04950 [Arthrobacter sp. HMSC08H08]OFT44119.1 hypothetical protein HMPREF3160_01150 [Arthrobacter sp. HMSC06H05]